MDPAGDSRLGLNAPLSENQKRQNGTQALFGVGKKLKVRSKKDGAAPARETVGRGFSRAKERHDAGNEIRTRSGGGGGVRPVVRRGAATGRAGAGASRARRCPRRRRARRS